MTRTANSDGQWGPCVDARGRFGERVGARAMVSLHADGAAAQDRGFHVIAPTRRTPWTADIAGPSLRLAKSLRYAMVASGLPPSNYTGEGTGLNVRDDLGTLNLPAGTHTLRVSAPDGGWELDWMRFTRMPKLFSLPRLAV